MADLAQPDLTALRWVQSELEQTLTLASEQLDALITHKNNGQTHAQALKAIEQVRGALTLIGLAGLSHFVRACETLFAQLAIPASCGQCDEQLALVQRALDATADYLAEILNGALNQPLRLFDLFAEVRAATEGAAPALPSDLFFPRSIDSRPVADGDGEPAPSATPSQDQERTLRVLYQRGLLAVLRDGNSEAGIQSMLDAARSIKRLRAHGSEISALWQVAQALLEAIANGDLPLSDTIKRLCAALERQLRRGSSLSDETAQQLLREMLYQVIPVPPRSQLQQSVHSKWQLASHLPTPSTRYAVTARAANALRKELKALRLAWEDYHAQKPHAGFDQKLRDFAHQTRILQRPWLDTFLQRLTAFTAWQSDSPAALPKPIAVEFAAALLLLDNAIARSEPAEYVPAQLNRTFERIEQLCHARPLTPLSALDRQATEQDALNAVAQIVILALDEAEQVLEACFQNPAQRAPLSALSARLQQSQDALFFVGDDQAAALLQHISLHIEQLARASRPLSEKEAQTLAHRISALNLYLQNIRQGQYTHLSSFLRLQKPARSRSITARAAARQTPPPADTAEPAPDAADEEAQLRETFFAEADTILAEIAPCNQLDALDTAALASLRRAYHTLKGSGRLVGLSRLSDTAWAIEEAFNRYLATPDQPPAELLALAAQAHAFFSAWLKALQAGSAEADPAALIQQAKQVLQQHETAPTASAKVTSEPEDRPDPHLQAVFIEESSELLGQMYDAISSWQNAPQDDEAPKHIARLLHTLKGNAHMTGLARLGSHFHRAESLLSQEITTPAQYADLIASLHEVIDHARERISQLEQTTPSGETGTAHAPRHDAAQSVRVRTLTLQQLAQQNGDIRLTHARIENQLGAMREHLRDLSESLTRLREQTRETELQSDLQLRSREPDSAAGEQFFDPLEQDRYTRLQELSRHIVESADDIAAIEQGLMHTLNQTQTTLRQQDNASRLMERTLADTRSTAFSDIVERLQRVVRQSANTLGKQVQLQISGSENRIERNLLEQLTAPLEHLLRNALAHGIESSAEREALGKPPCGHISLAISRSNEALQIELSDDGCGLDLDLLASKGRELGLLAADSTPDEDVLARLIFHPGFSTAEDLSTVSGRGIGMDIVQSAIDAANGRLEVHSQTGQGTRFQIQLPLTSLFTPVMLVSEGEHLLAIAANFIAHIPEIASLQGEQIEYGGSMHQVTPLAELLGQQEQPAERKMRVLLLRAGAKTLALGVEKIIGGQEIILKNAGPQLARIPGIQGAALTAGGQIALLINPFALNSLHGGATPAARINQPQHGAILIVDDSLTVRKALALTVARSKRPVLTARNGAEALERLQGNGNPPVDLVISDLEMPLMDGFELLEQLSQSPKTAHIPVFIITSRLAEKHRLRALTLGARQYLGKPYQDEALLALIEHTLDAPPGL